MRFIFGYARRYGWLVAFCLVTKMLASFAELFIPELLAEIEAKVRAMAAETPADEEIETVDEDEEFDIREFDLGDE